jgi:hypothetical protein
MRYASDTGRMSKLMVKDGGNGDVVHAVRYVKRGRGRDHGELRQCLVGWTRIGEVDPPAAIDPPYVVALWGKPPSVSSNWRLVSRRQVKRGRLSQTVLAADGRVDRAGFPAMLLGLAYQLTRFLTDLILVRTAPTPSSAPRCLRCAISSVSWSARSASPPGSQAIASCWLP